MQSENKKNKPITDEIRNKGNIWASDLKRKRTPGPNINGHSYLDKGISTKSVHAGQYDDPQTGAVGTPIFQSSTFFLGPDQYEAIVDGCARENFIYTRYGNPSQWAVQEKLAALENAESSIVFSSGMAAISTAIMALMDKGSHMITSRDLYGGTYNFFYEDLSQLGMSCSFVDVTTPSQIEAAITDKTKLLFFESLTNPLLKLIPLEEVMKIAKKYNLRVIIDNTFLTPYNFNPLDYGADIVVHSASKYLNGHTDLIAGVAMGSRKLIDRLWPQMLKYGGSMDPHAAFLLERGLKTFAIRMKTIQENAIQLSEYLEAHPKVRRVHYPGLQSHNQYELSQKQLKGYSGMLSFEVESDEASNKMLSYLKLPREATSLGGVESLISLPYNTSQASLMRSQLDEIGINPGLTRLSVGIEDIEDLIADFKQALEKI